MFSLACRRRRRRRRDPKDFHPLHWNLFSVIILSPLVDDARYYLLVHRSLLERTRHALFLLPVLSRDRQPPPKERERGEERDRNTISALVRVHSDPYFLVSYLCQPCSSSCLMAMTIRSHRIRFAKGFSLLICGICRLRDFCRR